MCEKGRGGPVRGCSCRDILSLFQRKSLLLMGETFFVIRKDWQENLKNLRECEKYAKIFS